ncbi:hypothetical protein CY0110_17942 [Crocosphaera chwakensis CCY0110]|uniref:Uncharacterized protein n=1 Tax=Crocosphaera chwakensis CCY0110 TaxID=391612 RepID=A3IIS0_9CHRO|nr:hypothetical protein CY0110_17942 [Crocosphaera chwakensis CCY0110]
MSLSKLAPKSLTLVCADNSVALVSVLLEHPKLNPL